MARPTRWTLLAFAALACAFAWPIQGGFDNERSHTHSCVLSLTGRRRSTGRVSRPATRSAATSHSGTGHTYSNKAPGLAFISVPVYAAARALGVPASGDSSRMLWVLSLFGAVLPAVVLLLPRPSRWATRSHHGRERSSRSSFGAATLVLPFATLYYSHVLAATLVFGCVRDAVLAPRPRGRSLAAVLAGAAAGYAVTTEYATLLAAVALCGYAASRATADSRAAAYSSASRPGSPLLVYDQWASVRPSTSPGPEGTTRGGELPSGEIVTSCKPGVEPLLESLFGLSAAWSSRRRSSRPPWPDSFSSRAGASCRGGDDPCCSQRIPASSTRASAPASTRYSGGERYLIAVLPLLLLPLGSRWCAGRRRRSRSPLVSGLLMVVLASAHVRVGEPDWLDGLARASIPVRPWSRSSASPGGTRCCRSSSWSRWPSRARSPESRARRPTQRDSLRGLRGARVGGACRLSTLTVNTGDSGVLRHTFPWLVSPWRSRSSSFCWLVPGREALEKP